ncbi:dTDP-glucose 4,6-dehydratase [Halopolyspora algeriensis]|uniref:dTDP-glucose 4,6-dehydratase n=1 Tax=Halopolyspora algeriensis TaxID=1500506 RepID=A0A368VTV8_9ACTN|nr:NAD-dependent epimerase/dehydratase family protein [Halopolyspora algeriensis]RCW44626.1 dTDP-glucose 4,6-dehydratase [Halopolyspora algeriensis]TQM55987.1 dTDP-glucose 4,6-dehydratase [Halopolyspora algeriensis]
MVRSGFQRAVVTGGAGFLGSHLCEQLVSRGTEVLCLDNFVTGSSRNVRECATDSRFRLVECDVTRPLPVTGDVDLVVHLASPASPKDYQRLPIETMLVGGQGCMQALELATEKEARFLLASTSEVYGDPLEHPQRESYWGNVNPIGPRSVYDEAKRYAEALTCAYRRERGTRAGIARIFNSYGPRMQPDDGRMVPTFVCQALRGKPLTVAGSGRQTRSVCYASDTVRGLLALADSGCEGPLNIGNPQEYSVLYLAETIRDLAGGTAPIEFVAGAADDPRRRCPDITAAEEQLGWQPEIGMHEGLLHTLHWFAELLGVDTASDRVRLPSSRA